MLEKKKKGPFHVRPYQVYFPSLAVHHACPAKSNIKNRISLYCSFNWIDFSSFFFFFFFFLLYMPFVLCVDLINARSLQSIESSSMIVCIDQPFLLSTTPFSDDDEEEVNHRVDTNRVLQMIHGGGSQWNTINRWFDKTVQVLCCQKNKIK